VQCPCLLAVWLSVWPKKEAELMQKWWVEICQAYLLPSFNGPAANCGRDGGGHSRIRIRSWNSSRAQAHRRRNLSLFASNFFFGCFPVAQGNFMHNFRSMPDSFLFLLFLLLIFFSAVIFTCGGHWPLHILDRIFPNALNIFHCPVKCLVLYLFSGGC